jgi:hypothetical protein
MGFVGTAVDHTAGLVENTVAVGMEVVGTDSADRAVWEDIGLGAGEALTQNKSILRCSAITVFRKLLVVQNTLTRRTWHQKGNHSAAGDPRHAQQTGDGPPVARQPLASLRLRKDIQN